MTARGHRFSYLAWLVLYSDFLTLPFSEGLQSLDGFGWTKMVWNQPIFNSRDYSSPKGHFWSSFGLDFQLKATKDRFWQCFSLKKFVKVDQPRLKTHIKCSQGREDSVDIKNFPFGPGTRGQSCKNVKIRFLKKLCDIFFKISNLS